MFDIAIMYILLFILHAVTIPSVVAAASRSRSGSNSKDNKNHDSLYTKYPPGYTVYGMDDGGCFFCAESQTSPGSTIPLIGGELNEHCRMMCEADIDCVAYTVARPQGKTIFTRRI